MKAFDVPKEYLGKRATCAGCKNKFVVEASSNESKADALDDYKLQAEASLPEWMTKEIPISAPAMSPPALKPAAPTPEKPEIKGFQIEPAPKRTPAGSGRRSSVNIWVPIVASCVSVVVGYFVGREHLKYELRTTVQQAFKNAFPGLAPEKKSSVATSPLPTPAAEKPLNFNEQFEKDGIAIEIVGAVIGKAKLVTGIRDDRYDTDEDYLTLTFKFTNKEQRKVRTFRESLNKFSGNYLLLKDDVDNVVRGVDFGFSSSVVGEVKNFADIAPGDSVQHVKVFSLPLPKTQYLVLTIDLQCVGGDGEVRYQIPMDAIARAR